MDRKEIVPSPVASALLEAAEHMADGHIDIGDRRVLIRQGKVVGVDPASPDPRLEDFLEEAGRLSATEAARVREAHAEGKDVLGVLRSILPEAILDESIRRIWVERLSHGIASMERRDEDPPLFSPASPPWDGRTSVHTVPLLLEAFSRQATSGDAEVVGTQMDRL
ncbi:MAG: hypothetical protein KC416_12675, partial [Myxococcales bacterium]|nr:hypothetical protein [Myxococcales bacterium]